MTIASALTAMNTDIKNARTAITNKGGTVTSGGGSSQLATDIATIPTGSAPVITSLSVTPTTSAQTITAPSGTDGYSPVNVAAVTSSIDANIQAGNIKKDIQILGVTGTLESGIIPSGTLNITQNGNYDVTNYASANVNVSGGGSGTTDVPLTRVSDDNGNEIGTHYMNFEDANGNVFKVILLDAQYRNASTQWLVVNSAVTNMPLYNNLKTANVWMAKETATTNTQLILDYCAYEGYFSTSCLHCRNQLFTISGVTYIGQLPNIEELLYLAKHYSEFDSLDTSASGHSSTNFSSARTIWSSSQYGVKYGWCLFNYGNWNAGTKSDEHFTCPILEIPL